jgi:predicted kinase
VSERLPHLIIISGPPCSGKTTIGRRLAVDLKLPYFYKDGIKEVLYDRLGWGEREWSRQLGVASTDLLYHIAESLLAADCSLMLESNFDPAFANERFLEMQRTYPFTALQIYCSAAHQTLLNRYHERAQSGVRHPGHVDRQVDLEFGEMLRQNRNGPLEIANETLIVDTTDFDAVDYPALLQTIRSRINNACD